VLWANLPSGAERCQPGAAPEPFPDFCFYIYKEIAIDKSVFDEYYGKTSYLLEDVRSFLYSSISREFLVFLLNVDKG
jgi:hypothetical protein